MRTCLGLSSLVVLVFTAGALPAMADCEPRQLSDGSWTTDCPSQSPSVPSANFPDSDEPGQTIITCATNYGTCTFQTETPLPSGTPCRCNTNNGPIQGVSSW
jgi:hypothetical protein